MRWFVGHGPAVTAILPLQAMRQCAVGYADGSVAVYSIETSVEEVVVKACEACAKKEEQIEAQQARLCVMDAELVKTRRVAREKVAMRTDGEA